MNPFAMQDADHEHVINKQELDDARIDAHREIFPEMPDACHESCLLRNPWGFCSEGECFPRCTLGRNLRGGE